MEKEIKDHAEVLWNYLHLGQALKKCDCVIAMGSHDLRVAEYAADLVVNEWSPLLVCSGGLGRLTREIWKESEAEKFARIARNCGVPAGQILIEDQSTNTGENILFTKKLLNENGYAIHSAILVHKPYMERRSLATVMHYWPEMDVVISSPPIAFEEYATADIPMEEIIHIMVGDFQRILEYPKLGYQAEQEAPKEALNAYKFLKAEGFTRHLMSE